MEGHRSGNDNNNDNIINILKKKSLNGVDEMSPVETNLAAWSSSHHSGVVIELRTKSLSNNATVCFVIYYH